MPKPRSATAKKPLKKVGGFILVLGFILLAFPSLYKLSSGPHLPSLQRPVLRPSQPPQTVVAEPIKIDPQLLQTKKLHLPPERILVPELKVDLPIVEAPVVAGYWELSPSTASHGVGSASPGEVGNTVVFAHARDELFGPLRQSKEGTVVYLLTHDQYFRYKIKEIKLVDPTEVTTVGPSAEEKLTLFTCSGFLDTKRLIISAYPDR